MSFQGAPRKIFGLIQPTTPTQHPPKQHSTIDTTVHQDDTADVKSQEMEKKCSQTAQAIISFLTKTNKEIVSDMSRLSYVYDMNDMDQVPRQVFKTQLETSLSHKTEVRHFQDAPLVIEALSKRRQDVFKKKKEQIHLHSLEGKPRKRVKIFEDISSSEDEKVSVDASEQRASKTVDEQLREGGLFGFSHLMPKINRLQDSAVADEKDLLIVEEDFETEVTMTRLKEETECEEFEVSENEDEEDKPTLSRKRMAQKAERKIDKQVRAIEKILPRDKN